MACNEACQNAIEHAYELGADLFDVVLERSGRDVAITVRDHGSWKSTTSPDRGRGLELMRELMDAVEVDGSELGSTIALRRRLRVAAAADPSPRRRGELTQALARPRRAPARRGIGSAHGRPAAAAAPPSAGRGRDQAHGHRRAGRRPAPADADGGLRERARGPARRSRRRWSRPPRGRWRAPPDDPDLCRPRAARRTRTAPSTGTFSAKLPAVDRARDPHAPGRRAVEVRGWLRDAGQRRRAPRSSRPTTSSASRCGRRTATSSSRTTGAVGGVRRAGGVPALRRRARRRPGRARPRASASTRRRCTCRAATSSIGDDFFFVGIDYPLLTFEEGILEAPSQAAQDGVLRDVYRRYLDARRTFVAGRHDAAGAAGGAARVPPRRRDVGRGPLRRQRARHAPADLPHRHVRRARGARRGRPLSRRSSATRARPRG